MSETFTTTRGQERKRRLLPGNEPRYVRCYDNEGETADRYSVIFTGRYRQMTGGETQVLSMSGSPFHPQGVGLHGGYMNIPDVGPKGQWPPAVGRRNHLGLRILFKDLPEDCRRLVLADYITLWEIKDAHLCANGHCASLETTYYPDRGVWACSKHFRVYPQYEAIQGFNEEDRTAEKLARANFDPTDAYHKHIKGGAQAMVEENKGQYIYVTQYSSGSTVWRHPKTDARQIVDVQRGGEPN